mmetsp:Transcript_8699/g.31865  ORF Transcript_8699/g.31865 Transcript_8699/m.31865 type:complete len:230 (-) Transcript_8699:444-1133(-)
MTRAHCTPCDSLTVTAGPLPGRLAAALAALDSNVAPKSSTRTTDPPVASARGASLAAPMASRPPEMMSTVTSSEAIVLDSSSTYAAAVALSKSKSSDSSSARTPPGPRVHGPPAHTSIRPGPPRRRIIAAAVSIATPAHRALPATGPALRPAGLIDEMTASSAARHARAGAMNRPIEPPPSPPPSSSSSSSFPKNASRSAARGDFAPESTSALATALAPPNSYTATDAA